MFNNAKERVKKCKLNFQIEGSGEVVVVEVFEWMSEKFI